MRNEFLYKDISKKSNILEIGPSFSPLYPKSEGYNTEIVDYLDETQLKKEYSSNTEKILDKIEKVDYVCSRHYADIIKKYKFYDIIAASHVIEHVVDLIEFLNDCSKLLKDNGKIKLIIPDKRYEFDYFKEESSIRNVIDGHIYRKNCASHSLGTKVESILNTVHIDGSGTYISNSALVYKEDMKFSWDRISNGIVNSLVTEINNYNEDKYINMHSWIFTPKSFEILIYQLNILRFTDLKIEEIFTIKNSVEFYVTLIKKKEIFDGDYMANLHIEHKKEYMESWSNYNELMKAVNEEEKLYIFGSGVSSKRIIRFLEILNVSYSGHVVSDGYKKTNFYNGHNVYELKEIKDIANICILLGISSQFRSDVCKGLELLQIKYIF